MINILHLTKLRNSQHNANFTTTPIKRIENKKNSLHYTEAAI